MQAPRGEILDRDGKMLVDNRTALALQVRDDELPGHAKRRKRVLERLGEVAGMTLRARSRSRSASRPRSCRRAR